MIMSSVFFFPFSLETYLKPSFILFIMKYLTPANGIVNVIFILR